MLSAKLRPCASQFGKFMVPLRVRYSTAVEQSFEHIKVSTPRPGVGLGTNRFPTVDSDCKRTYPSNKFLLQLSFLVPRLSMHYSRLSSPSSTPP
jgi:enoyl-CoA hydratase